jgi:hypothetical protein
MENKKIYMVTELTETTNEPQVAQQSVSRPSRLNKQINRQAKCK